MRALVLVPMLALAACASSGNLVVDGPVGPPLKPAYTPSAVEANAPDANLMDDFILASGSNTVLFPTNSFELDGRSRDTLDRQSAWMMTHRDASFLIEGHADERASVPYNKVLGRKRAEAVVDYLVGKGIRRTRLTARSFGKGKPIIDRYGDIQINRRAVVVIQGLAD